MITKQKDVLNSDNTFVLHKARIANPHFSRTVISLMTIRSWLLSTIHFILFGNIYIAVGAVFLVQSTCVQLGLQTHLKEYSLMVFFSTLFVYNLQRLFYIPQLDKSLDSIRRKWILENNALVKILTIIGFLGVLFTLKNLDNRIFSPLLLLFIFSLAYFIPAVKLRKHPLFKLLTLTVVWTMATAALPILLDGSELFTKINAMHLFSRFCFIAAIAIPFDIRDLKIDAADNVLTLSRLIGENKAKWLAFGLMLMSISIIVFKNNLGITNEKVVEAFLITTIINAFLVFLGGSPKRSEYFYLVLVDGAMIFQGAALLGAQLLY